MSDIFSDWLSDRAASVPDRRALVFGERSWTFAEFDRDVTTLARRLATLGVRANDRVATLLHNGFEAAAMPHALLRLGATLVPLNTRLTPAEIEWQIADVNPRLLIVENRTLPGTDIVRQRQPSLRIVGIDRESAHALGADSLMSVSQSDVALTTEHDGSDVLAIIYTSGTTGKPKGAMLTVSNFWWSAIGSALNIGSQSGDAWVASMPLFHVGGLSIILRSAIYGITAVVQDGFDQDAVNHAIDDGATIVSVVAVMLERMLDARKNSPFPSTLRCVLLGGGPASPALLERCVRLRVPVAQTYGLTETCSQVATMQVEDATRKPGASGKPLYPNSIRIAGGSSDEGEILIKGPVVMAGYFNRPGETGKAIVGGWLHTGDIGRIDSDGYLYVLDRRDDLIISGGENVYPAEIEAALMEHPGVIEAGVIGVEDAKWGQHIEAFVRCEPGAIDEAALTAHCSSRLAGYKRPSNFHFVNEPLPRTASGKLQRVKLREMLSSAVSPR